MDMDDLKNHLEKVGVDTKENVKENSYVLERIFHYCTEKTLKNVRLAAPFLNEECKRAWQSSATVYLDKDNPTRITDYVEFLNDSFQKSDNFVPISKYTLSGEMPEDFWSACGEHIKFLNLSGMETVDDYMFCKLNRYCPNLRDLTLSSVTIKGNVQNTQETVVEEDPAPKILAVLTSLTITDSFIGSSWAKLLKTFPSLKVLNVTGETAGYDELIQTLQNIRKNDPNKLPLTNIWIPFEEVVFDAYDVGYISDEFLPADNIHLKQVSIVAEKAEEASKIQLVLRDHGEFLQKLKIVSYGDPPCLNPATVFPIKPSGDRQLLNLRELYINSHLFFSSFEFLRYTPNLEVLGIASVRDYLRPAFPEMPDVKLFHCINLTISGQIMTLDLKILMNTLPNLEVLEAELDNEQFSLICERWPNLTSLCLVSGNGSVVDDSGITGLSLRDVDEINRSCESKPEVNKKYHATKPNILNLQSLNEFSTRHGFYVGSSKLGLCSALYGFQQLPSLKELSISMRTNHKIWGTNNMKMFKCLGRIGT